MRRLLPLLMKLNAKPKVSLKPFQRLAESRDSVSGGSRAEPLWVLRAKPLVAVYGGETHHSLHELPIANNPVNCLRTRNLPINGGRTDKQHTKSSIWIVMLYAALL